MCLLLWHWWLEPRWWWCKQISNLLLGRRKRTLINVLVLVPQKGLEPLTFDLQSYFTYSRPTSSDESWNAEAISHQSCKFYWTFSWEGDSIRFLRLPQRLCGRLAAAARWRRKAWQRDFGSVDFRLVLSSLKCRICFWQIHLWSDIKNHLKGDMNWN